MTILGGARIDEPRAAAHGLRYDDIPEVEPGAVVDPHWVDLQGSSTLPVAYLPPAMPGRRSLWTRIVAGLMVGLFLGATAAGVCLTYGPPLGRI